MVGFVLFTLTTRRPLTPLQNREEKKKGTRTRAGKLWQEDYHYKSTQGYSEIRRLGNVFMRPRRERVSRETLTPPKIGATRTNNLKLLCNSTANEGGEECEGGNTR